MARERSPGSGPARGGARKRGGPPAPVGTSAGKPRTEVAAKAPRRPAETPRRERDTRDAEKPAIPRPEGGRIALFGIHAVREALRTRRRRIFDVFATKDAADRLSAEIAAAGLAARIVEARDLARRLGANAVHQGIMVEAGPLPSIDLSEIVTRSGLVLVLDQITDPHNVGAILRTAAAFGVDALVTTERHAPEFSGLLAKAASGGLEHVTIVTMVNLARALEHLGDMGYLRIGLDSEAGASLADLPLPRPLALVLGGEGKGLRRLTREKCDHLARLDLPGAIKSLNVSNACAVALTLVGAGKTP